MSDQPDAWLYEVRYGEWDSWTGRASVQSPAALGFEHAENIDIRNVRPLHEVADDE